MDDKFDRIDHLLDELEAIDPTYAANHTKVALGFIKDEAPSTIDVAALYLQWAISKKSIIVNGFTDPCNCDSGWVYVTPNSVSPCPACRSESNDKWYTEFVNSEREPQ